MLEVKAYALYNSSDGGEVTKITLTAENYSAKLAEIKDG